MLHSGLAELAELQTKVSSARSLRTSLPMVGSRDVLPTIEEEEEVRLSA